MIQNQGTNIYSAINLAIDNISEDENNHKTIILISDGEEHENDYKNIIQTIKDKGIRIHSLGVGSIRGAPIPIYDEKYNAQGYGEIIKIDGDNLLISWIRNGVNSFPFINFLLAFFIELFIHPCTIFLSIVTSLTI